MKNILIWLIIFFIFISLYAFRFELDYFKTRIFAVLIPNYSWSDTKGQITIARHSNGHFYVDGYGGGGQKIHFLIDTGASDVALSADDAKKLGFNLKDLNYTRRYSTANGEILAAPIRIRELKIGGKILYDLPASVSKSGLDTSLLGMAALDDFKHFRFMQDMLILEY